jgi:predicted ATPase/class 3 adenylate cyclase
MNHYPSGTVAFLFTDIEGSTKLAQQFAEKWESLRARHHAIVKSAIESQNGYIFQVIGDAFCAAFHTAGEALHAAVQAQGNLHNEDWGDTPIKVRMGIHTGEAQVQHEGDYQGYLTLSRAQRLMSAGHGGQILISMSTRMLVSERLPKNVWLRDMGERQLKNIVQPERIFQVVIQGLPAEFPPLNTMDLLHHNLPSQTTSFIGREREITDIIHSIQRHRLVTLTGSGGTGKTRLSLQVAESLLNAFSDGIWFIELATLINPELLPRTILSAMGIAQEPEKTALQSLTGHLHGKNVLLLLDNCEHLIEAIARLVDHLLGALASLKILASSREALGIKGELAWPVPSLSLPDLEQHPTLEQLSQNEAIRLFVERARLVQPHFEMTTGNASAIAQICHRLDGIPLALELAAARVKALDVDQIASRLDDRFRLLTGGARTALPRQQTLRATIDWSYNLLSEQEKILFSRLAVFVGGWRLEAAEQVGGDARNELDILDLMTHLVDKSLVLLEEGRYRMLETTRQYAREKLFDSEESDTLRDRHLDYFSKYAEQNNILEGRPIDVDLAINNFRTEQADLRAALQWAMDSRPDKIFDIATPLSGFYVANLREEGSQWMEKVLSLTEPIASAPRIQLMFNLAFCLNNTISSSRALQIASQALKDAKTLNDLKLLSESYGRYGAIVAEAENREAAIAYYEQAISLARQSDNIVVLSYCLNELGAIHALKGNVELAESHFQESLKLSAKAPHFLGMRGTTNLFLAGFALTRGDVLTAHNQIDLALSAQRNANTRPLYTAHLLEMLGRVQVAEGDLELARQSLRESLETIHRLKSRPCLAHGLEAQARLAIAENNPSRAVHFLGCGEAHLESIKMSMIAYEKLLYDKTVEETQTILPEAEFATAWEVGRSMNIEVAIHMALRTHDD